MKHFLRYFLLFFSVLLLSTSFVDADTIVRKAGAKVKMTDSYRNELLASGEKLKKGHHVITLLTEYSPKQFEKIGGRSGHSDEVRNGEVKLLENSDAFYLWWVQYCDEYVPDHGINRQTVVGLTDELYYFSASDLAEVLPESTVSPSLMTQKGSCAFWKYDKWEKNGFSIIDEFRWSGDVSDGFIDGSGEGYCVKKEGDSRDLYFVKGTFKRGMPVGACQFIQVCLSISYFMRSGVQIYNNTESELSGIKDYSSFIIYDQTTGCYQKCFKEPGPIYVKYNMNPDGTVLGPAEETMHELEFYADSFLSIMTDEYSVESLKQYEARTKKMVYKVDNGVNYHTFVSFVGRVKDSIPEESPLRNKINACGALYELYCWFNLPDYGLNFILPLLEKAAYNIPEKYAVQRVEEAYDYHLRHPFITEYEKLLSNPYFSKRDDKITESYVRAFYDGKNELVEEAHKKNLAIAQQRVDSYYQKQRSSAEENNYSHNVIDLNNCRKPRGELVQSFLSSIWRHLNDGYIYFKNEKQDSYYSVKYNILYNKDKSFNCYTITGAFFPVAGDFSSYSEMIDAIEKAYAKYKQR